MNNFDRPLAELSAAVNSGDVSATELVEASLARIAATSDAHAVLEINPLALERAKSVKTGRLAGVPFIAKDNFLTLGTHTTAASNILKPFEAPYQSTAVTRLEASGAIMVAKANMDAFAHGSSTENSDFGATKNPWNHDYVPGGSSGGSAASVALSQAGFALGTDTGGSIRLPAAYCGVVGLKPTYGLVSRYGVMAMASSTDVIGPLTRSVADAALVLDVMAGPDPHDATTIVRDEAGYTDITADVAGKRVAIIKEYMGEGVDAETLAAVRRSADQLERAGAKVEEISLPAVDMALACYYILVPAEISSNLSRYDGVKYGFSAPEAKNLEETYELSRDQGFGLEAKRRILIGAYVLSSGYYDAYYKQAQQVRTLLVHQFNEAFAKYDLLLGPTAPGTAFRLGEKSKDPLSMYLTDIMTVAANLVGCGAISLPAGMSAGLPIGVQMMAQQRAERTLLSAAMELERSLEPIGAPA